ncbi:MAG: hypothetical protein ACOY31_05995 [Bacillota bacterium]
MTTAVSIADFRSNMRKMLEKALSGREIVCINTKSKDRESCSFIKTKLLLDILTAYSFQPRIFYDENTKTHNIHLDELKLYSYSDTLDDAIEQIVDLTIDYVKDYIDRLELFLNVPGRKEQYPYVLRLSHCSGREEVKEMIMDNTHGNV